MRSRSAHQFGGWRSWGRVAAAREVAITFTVPQPEAEAGNFWLRHRLNVFQ
ncbi:MAG: hypothetical protein PUP93_03520 [Rhizonema sp. NSF051]|nr:hypothetical protein [Rhizonema sp. NSF051]